MPLYQTQHEEDKSVKQHVHIFLRAYWSFDYPTPNEMNIKLDKWVCLNPILHTHPLKASEQRIFRWYNTVIGASTNFPGIGRSSEAFAEVKDAAKCVMRPAGVEKLKILSVDSSESPHHGIFIQKIAKYRRYWQPQQRVCQAATSLTVTRSSHIIACRHKQMKIIEQKRLWTTGRLWRSSWDEN